MVEVDRHLVAFLKRRPYASFEEWIQELHPENLRTDPRTGEVKVDHRFYSKRGQHRQRWNCHVDPSRQVFASLPGSLVITRSMPATPRLPMTPRISVTPRCPMSPRISMTPGCPMSPRLLSRPLRLCSAASTPAFPTNAPFSHVSSELFLPACACGPPSARGVCCVSSPRCTTPSRETVQPRLTRVDGMAWLDSRTETPSEPQVRRRSIPPPAFLRVQLAPMPVLHSNTSLLQRPQQRLLVRSVPQLNLQRPPTHIAAVTHKQQVHFWPQASAGCAAIWPQTAAFAAPSVPLQPFWSSKGVCQPTLQTTTRVEAHAASLGGA